MSFTKGDGSSIDNEYFNLTNSSFQNWFKNCEIIRLELSLINI